MKTKLTAIILALTMLFTFAACSKDSVSNDKSDDNDVISDEGSGAEEPENEPEPEDEPEEEPESTDTEPEDPQPEPEPEPESEPEPEPEINPEYTAVFEQYGIDGTPTEFEGLESRSYVMDNDDIIEKFDFGYSDDIVYKMNDTCYFSLDGYTDEQIDVIDETMREQFDVLNDYDFSSIEYEITDDYYIVRIEYSDLNIRDNIETITETGSLGMASDEYDFISITETEKGLKDTGYICSSLDSLVPESDIDSAEPDSDEAPDSANTPDSTNTMDTDDLNPEYVAFCEEYGIDGTPMEFDGYKSRTYIAEDSAVIDRMDFGYGGIVIDEAIHDMVETCYFPLDGYTEDEISEIDEAMREQFDPMSDYDFATVEYETTESYYIIRLAFTDLDDTDNVSILQDIGYTIDSTGIVFYMSIKITDENLLEMGYICCYTDTLE